MFENYTLDMRLEDLGYKPKKVPDTIKIDSLGKIFTKSEISTLIDLISMYDIKYFSIHKNYALFSDEDDMNETIFKYS